MKILSLRFQNLNSLKYEWFIDFDSDEFQQESLFLISGPTGSGKTTILDAICLALYHRTPRLKSLSKESNELMTRHTGLCFSELTFTTGNKKYRARWEQHRAGKKKSGSLQPPRCELCLADSGEVITTKLAEKLKTVEQICGLNFERFTRSILLAQGNFTAFLKADKKKKAELLEEITGTEIYGQISILAFRRMRAEEEKLKLLESGLQHLEIIAPEELKALKQASKNSSKELNSLQKERELVTQQINWLKLICDLESKFSENQKALSKSNEEYLKHQKDFEKLALALPAQKIQQLLEHRNNLKNEVQSLEKNKEVVQKEKQEITLKLTADNKKHIALEENYQKFTSEKATQEKLIHHEIMPLDKQIISLQEQITDPFNTLEQKKELLSTYEKQVRQLKDKRRQIEKYLSDTQNWLTQNSHLEDLSPKLQLISHKIQEVTQLDNALMAKQKALKETREELGSIDQKINLNQQEIQQQISATDTFEKKQQNFKDEIKKLDPNGTLVEQLNQCKERNALSQSLPSTALKLRDLSHRINTRNSRLAHLNPQIEKVKTLLPKLESELQDKKKILDQARKLLEQERTILDLKQYRDQLKSGDPCMVCGSREHPAITEYSNLDVNQTKNQQAEAEANFNSLQKSYIETTKDLEKLQADVNQAKLEIAKDNELWESDLRGWSHNCKNLQVTLDYSDEAQVQNFTKSFNSQLASLQKAATELLSLEEKQKFLEKELQKNKDALNSQQAQIGILNEQKKQTEKSLELLTKDFSTEQSHSHEIKQEIEELLRAFPQGNNFVERLQIAQTAVKHFCETQNNQLETNNQRQKFELELNNCNETIFNLQSDLEALNKKVNEIGLQIKSSQDSRIEKFGTESTEKTLQLLANESKKLSISLEQSRENLTELQKNSTALAAQSQEIENNLQSKIKLYQQAELEYSDSLNQSPFADEATLLANCLSSETIKDLQSLQLQFSETLTRHKTRVEDLEKQISQEKEKVLTETPIDELKENLLDISTKLQNVATQKNKFDLKIKQQEQLKETQAKKVAAIKEQQSNFNLWATLSSLIGSADGQAFRNFAQGLTLDHLVSLANIHLERLHDRYFLARQEDDSLNLTIIDTYQADTIRPVETLSGGESFLVSLSLALALSDLASDRVNIESLFLDEGFGTLDPETLETALTALDHLQASGKMIGVISHVQILKERLPSKIQLYCNEGMGISRLNEEFAVIIEK